MLVFWRCFLLFAGAVIRHANSTSIEHGHPPDEREDWPVYSVLIPAYRESALLPQIANAMRTMNWPAGCLEILVLLEADDRKTIDAAEKANLPLGTRICVVPPGGPRTKPNALNLGLHLATGAYVTVFDVEDLPHPDQLQVAHNAFLNGPDRLACVQAPLLADNSKTNWLAANWGLEYAVQFNLLLPALSLYRMPLLLGGTSNHFRIEALRAFGGWDAWNVTEDADLGLRLARAGLSAAMINSVTYEDAPTDLSIWIKQRSRWIKGHMQTWLVHMRRPSKTIRQMGIVEFCAMQLCLGGGVLAPLFYAPCIISVAIVIASPDMELGLLGTLLLVSGLLIGLISDIVAPGPWSWRRVFAIATRPLYWPLHSIAAYRAIWELAKDPFFWAKTPHRPRATESAPSCSTGSSA